MAADARTRRAVVLDAFGGPDVLRTRSVEPAEPAPHEVRLAVEHATVNPTDILLRSGAQTALLESAAGPWTPGMELSGVVDAVGAAAAGAGLAPGDRVVALVNPRRVAGGAQSGWTCVPATWVARAPEQLDGAAAATLPMNGVTALMVLELLRSAGAATVLVTGAAGALGGYVVQLARHDGITVLGHGRPQDADTVLTLGAHHATSGDLAALRAQVHRLAPGGVDALVDTALLGDTTRDLVRPGGLVVHVRPGPAPDDGRRTETVSVMQRIGDAAALEQVVTWARSGVLTTRVHRLVPVDRAPEAYRLVEGGGTRGRVVLDLGPAPSPLHEGRTT